MSAVYVAGVGGSRFGRHDASVKQLVAEAVTEALADAGGTLADLQVAFFATAGQGHMEGQSMVAGQVALRALGAGGLPVFNVENACASSSSALHLARMHLAAGAAEIALVVGVDKLISADKEKSFTFFDGGWDVHEAADGLARLQRAAPALPIPAGQDSDGRRSVFVDIYAQLARMHMQAFGTTQRQIAAVAAKNHSHSALNPKAHFTHALSVDEVLAARTISWPLTLPMCAPISDGAVAAVVCSDAGLRRLDRWRAVRVLASAVRSGTDRPYEAHDRHLCRLAAQEAYAQAGVGPRDVSLAEVHDATAFAEIQQMEALGFCDPGEGGAFVESGRSALGGALPVNVGGGLLSRGHPVGATGLAQIHELVVQLRGEAGLRQVPSARIGLAENGGGFAGVEEAAACITILGR